ncbi:class I adenylate-forming enzyme family protein [Dickeya poaceiphila]|uniref:class I adenylate-forming enzyme family protein n=1 Tax=Dickeya poaceiphila TaxID=568768 RepID=UPI00039A132B|nr:class I adenylate-forming enzyme family protein [Dickeya poaceiphila]
MSISHLTNWLSKTVISRPDNIAIITTDEHVTWSELMTRVQNTAHYLKSQGVKRGDRVLVWLPNSIDFVVSFWATQYLQAVFVPVNPDTPLERVMWLLNNAEAFTLITEASRAGQLHAEPGQTTSVTVIYDSEPEDDKPSAATLSLRQIAAATFSQNVSVTSSLDVDLACLIYTSGSTGNPKGVMLTQRNMLSAATSVSTYLQLAADDRIYCAIPMSFDYGLYQAIMATRVGATLILERDFTRPLFALSHAVKNQATLLPIVPSMLSIIAPLASRYDLSSIRKITNTAAALHPADIDKLMNLFPQAEIFSMYGLTECHRCTWLPPAMLRENKESVGYAIPNTELWVVDEHGVAHTANATGELVIRGATVMSGYWRNEEQTKKKLRPGPLPGEQVLYTGDICRLDKNGLLYFISRQDDILKSCGEKVAPKEVESVIKRFPGVLQVAVLGLPHPVYGAEIVACIEAQDAIDLPALKAFCKTHLEAYKCPHRYVVKDQLTRNPNGKIDKHSLMASLTSLTQPETI